MIILPYQNEKTEEKYPTVTISLIVLNTLLFLFIYRMNLLRSYDFLYNWGFSWYLFHPVTLISTQFIHANFVHLAGNMLFLWLFGPVLEDELGEVYYLGFYLVGGVIATLIYGLTIPDFMVERPLVGASGSIAGLMGLYFVLFPKSDIKHFLFILIRYWTFSLPAWITLGYWFLLQVYNSHVAAASPVAHYAHIGGFLFGFGVGLYYKTAGWYQPAFQNMTDMNAVRNLHEIVPHLDDPAKITKFEEAIDQQPDNPELFYWYSITALRQGKTDRAQKVARDIINRYPKDYEKPSINAFLLYKRLGRTIQQTVEALRYARYLANIEEYQGAVDFLRDFLRRGNITTAEANRVRLRLATLLVDQLEKYEKAYDLLEDLESTVKKEDLRTVVDRKKRKLETFLGKNQERQAD